MCVCVCCWMFSTLPLSLSINYSNRLSSNSREKGAKENNIWTSMDARENITWQLLWNISSLHRQRDNFVVTRMQIMMIKVSRERSVLSEIIWKQREVKCAYTIKSHLVIDARSDRSLIFRSWNIVDDLSKSNMMTVSQSNGSIDQYTLRLVRRCASNDHWSYTERCLCSRRTMV